MSESIIQPIAQEDLPLVFASEILRDNAITDRCVRKWQSVGAFPGPDGKLNGRNFWRRSTYRNWQANVIAGRHQGVRANARPQS
jgi:hypothetical protein